MQGSHIENCLKVSSLLPVWIDGLLYEDDMY